jgi:predicted nucleotidyltransferase
MMLTKGSTMLFHISDTTRRELEQVCRKYHVQKLSIFGSTLHGDARPDSDLDVLVELTPGQPMGLFTFSRLERELTKILGRNVDLRTAEDLSRYFRDRVVKEAQPLYAAQ